MAQQYQVDIVTKVVGSSKIAQLDKALEQLAQNQKKVESQAQGVATSLNKLQAAAGKAGAATQGASTAAKNSAAGFKSMGAAINAAAAKITIIIGAVQAFSRVMGTAFERQNAEQRLKNLTGSTEEYEAALQSAAAISQKFGMTQTEATKALGDVYSRLSGVGYGLKEVTTIYQGFNAVARESGVSNEAASAAFLQLGQAMGSGVLQGDELRSILEQMPQLTQAIAQQMGIAASQVKQFGAEGKITSDVIFAALQKASLGATDLNAKLTPAQQQMNAFNKAIDSAGAALGTALIPALTGLLEAITPVIAAVGTLAEKLNELGVSKVFEFLMAPARAFGELVNGAANNTEDLSGKADEAVEKFSSLPQPIQSAKAATEQLKEQTQQLAAAQREYQAALGTEQGDIDRKLSVTQAVLAAERQINDAKLQQAQADLQAATSQGERESAAQRIYQLTISNAKLERDATLAAADAELKKVEAAVRHAQILQKQVQTEVALQRSKRIYNDQQDIALANAQQLVNTAHQSLAAQEQINNAITAGANAMYEKQVNAAEVVYQQTMMTSQQQQANAAIEQGAASMSRLADEAQRAASASSGIGGGGGGGGGRTSVSADVSHRIYDTYKLDSAGNIVETTQEERQRQMNQARLNKMNTRSRVAQAFDAAMYGSDYKRIVENSFRNGGPIGAVGSMMYEEAIRAAPNSLKWSMIENQNKYMAGYAEGGYVTGPQQAVVGEGGEPEYIIPSGKMDEAMQRYGSGMRGSSVIPESANVSVNYSGSTVDMGGTSYINKGDVNGIVSQAVNQTLTTLNRSAGARMRAGLR